MRYTVFSQEDMIKVAKFAGIKVTMVGGEACSECDDMLLPIIHRLRSASGQQTIIKKILTFAALHLEEIPKPEALIMPFCDVAGRDDYDGHGQTVEDAIMNAVLEFIKKGG